MIGLPPPPEGIVLAHFIVSDDVEALSALLHPKYSAAGWCSPER
jgi:hypothetical protein